jgi:NitT/TauT family transport system substrate-binding protein
MSRQRRFAWFFILVLAALFLQACVQGQAQSIPELGTIQVGYLPQLGYAPYYVAVDKGYFKEQGLDVALQSFQSGSVMIAPLSTGTLDVGSGEVGPALLNALAQGLDVKVVAGQSNIRSGYNSVAFLVRKDLFDSGEVVDPSGLNGKKISINIEHGQSEYLVAELLSLGGLTIDDVELVVLPFPDVPAAMANGAIDAGIMSYPGAAKVIAEGDGINLIDFAGDQGVIDIHQSSVMYFGKRLIDPANREVAVRFLVGYLKAVRELSGDGWLQEDNLTILSKYTNLPVENVKNSVRSYNDPNGEMFWPSVQRVQNYYLGRGYVEIEQPLSREQMVDDSLLEEVIERIGRVEP